MKCFAVSHQQQKPIPSRISKFHDAVRQVEITKKTFSESLNELEHKVQHRANEIKRHVDDHATKLIQELNEIKTSSVKEAKTRIESFELALTALESFLAYSSEIASKGSPCDITGMLMTYTSEQMNFWKLTSFLVSTVLQMSSLSLRISSM